MHATKCYEKCRDLFLLGVLDALDRSEFYFTSMERTAHGKILVNALDIFPWHASACLALRSSFMPEPDRYALADWPDYDFANDGTSAKLKAACDFAGDCYRNRPDAIALTEAAHLIFLAGAEALLDPAVADALNALGIEAPKLGEGIGGSAFEFLVLDSDQTCHANDCDIIRANRTTARLMKVWR